MTSQVIDLLEARQNMSRPRFAPRKLNPLNDSLPESVYGDLMKSYSQIYIGSRNWIATDKQGNPFDVTVIQTGHDLYDYTALAAYQMNGPDTAA